MAWNPADRYRPAAAMKAEVDAPAGVEVTGRATRLRVPVRWRSRWRIARIALLALAVPIALFFLFLHAESLTPMSQGYNNVC